MSSLDEFVEKYLNDDDTVKRYRVLSKLTDSFAMFLYIVILSIGLPMMIAISYIPQIQTGYFGIDNLSYIIVILTASAIGIWLYFIFLNRRKSYDLDERKVAFHFLASSLHSYEKESNLEKTRDYLKEFREYITASDRFVLRPQLQRGLLKYIEQIEDADRDELEKMLGDAFIDNMTTVSDDVLNHNDTEIVIPEGDNLTQNSPTTLRIVADVISDSVSMNHIKVFSGLSFFGIVIIALMYGGSQVALVLVGAFSIFQFLFSTVRRGDDE